MSTSRSSIDLTINSKHLHLLNAGLQFSTFPGLPAPGHTGRGCGSLYQAARQRVPGMSSLPAIPDFPGPPLLSLLTESRRLSPSAVRKPPLPVVDPDADHSTPEIAREASK